MQKFLLFITCTGLLVLGSISQAQENRMEGEEEIRSLHDKIKETRQELRESEDLEDREELEIYIASLEERLEEKREQFRQARKERAHSEIPQENPRFSEKEFIQRLQGENPRQYDKLIRLHYHNPERFRKLLEELQAREERREKMRQKDPETYSILQKIRSLDKKARQIGKQIQRSNPENREEKLHNLQTIINKIFDLKTSLQEKEVEQIRKSYEEAKEKLEKRVAQKNRITQHYLETLTGEYDELDW